MLILKTKTFHFSSFVCPISADIFSFLGRKGLKLIKRHFQCLLAAIFNIILHLQSPLIFYGGSTASVVNSPDQGSAILMCVEVLITISRKHALFQMDSWHIGHLLRIPAALFQNFQQLRVSKVSGQSDSLMISEEQISHRAKAVNLCYVDRQFSVNLFIACCQLLCTTIKHHQRYGSFIYIYTFNSGVCDLIK